MQGRKYSQKFKQEAVAQTILPGGKMRQIGEQLNWLVSVRVGAHRNTLSWSVRREY